MKKIEARMKKIMTDHCSQRGICKDTENQCIPKKCRYFKNVVLPTYRLDIRRRKGKYWLTGIEYADYEKVLDYLLSVSG